MTATALPSSSFDPAAVELAMRGLLLSAVRHVKIRQQHELDVGLINISAVEAANWICSIDEALWPEKGRHSDYEARRDADPAGQLLRGVRYVRDRHMHQVVVSAEHDGVDFFESFPPQFSAGVVWRPAADIPEGDRGRREKTNYKRARQAYVTHLQGRGTWHAVHGSGLWLTREVTARGLSVATWDLPLR